MCSSDLTLFLSGSFLDAHLAVPLTVVLAELSFGFPTRLIPTRFALYNPFALVSGCSFSSLHKVGCGGETGERDGEITCGVEILRRYFQIVLLFQPFRDAGKNGGLKETRNTVNEQISRRHLVLSLK